MERIVDNRFLKVMAGSILRNEADAVANLTMPEYREVLRSTKDREGWTLAHEIAKSGSGLLRKGLSAYPDILNVQTKTGVTVESQLSEAVR